MKKTSLIQESLKDIKNFKKIISEAYDDMGMDAQQPTDMSNDMQAPMGDEEMMQQPKKDPRQMSNHERMEASMNGEFNETENASPYANDGEMKSIIDQIRELAIQGIAKYSENVEDQRYQSLKRIWVETDKFYESFMSDKQKK